MRALAHLLSVALLLPGLVFATAFLALDHVTAQPGFLAFLAALLDVALIILPWALLSCVLLLVLALFGLSDRHRWAAALCVAGIVAGSTSILLWLGGIPATPADAWFLVPGVGALGIALWLAVSEWPGRTIRDRRTQ